MTEEEKIEVAVFRFGVICDLINRSNMSYGEKERIIKEKCDQKWEIPYSDRSSICRSTICDWVKKYKESHGKLESLYPKTRSDSGKSRSIDDETALTFIEKKRSQPDITICDLVNYVSQIHPGANKFPPSNVYRLLKNEGLVNPANPVRTDRRKYEAEHPNDLWQSDVMHGPKLLYNGKLRKSYLVAIIDDHSRLITHACFCYSENLKTYLKVLEQAFLTRGLPRKLYVDNGPAFRSNHLKYIAARLEIALIHARPYLPQGKGKIERWFRTVRMSFLPTFNGETIEHINAAFEKWLNTKYHQKKHSATGMTPYSRFTSKMECIRAAPKNLSDYFRKTAKRRVAKDRTVTLNCHLFEAPVCLIGKQVEVLYHDDTPENVEIIHKQTSYGFIKPLDLNVNCRVKRDKKLNNDIHIISENTSYKGGSLF